LKLLKFPKVLQETAKKKKAPLRRRKGSHLRAKKAFSQVNKRQRAGAREGLRRQSLELTFKSLGGDEKK